MSDNPNITWEDPPAVKHSKRFGAEFADALTANPGRWAVLRNDAPGGSFGNSTAQRFGWERASRKNPDGTYTIYVRVPEVKS